MNDYPIKESPLKEKYRKSLGMKVINVNARHLKLAFESDQKEPLMWKQQRLDKLRELVGSGVKIDDYPKVGIHDHYGTIGIGDGRHRITHAAERNENIGIAIDPKDEHLIIDRLNKEKHLEDTRKLAVKYKQESPMGGE